MNLDKFITETLVCIEKGVREANAQSEYKCFSLTPSDGRIEFDVAVQVTKSNETGVSSSAGIGVTNIIRVAEFGVDGKVESETAHTSRIQFKVRSEKVVM